MTMQKVSIIVPVYKVEKYLPKCIESILAQTYANWELLLIDDGSPDDSGILCDAYAAKDLRIRVFHKENGGVSSARNVGIVNASGVFLMFIDADDWIDARTIELCFAKSSDADLFRFGMQSLFKQGDAPSNVIRIDETLSLLDYRKLLVARKTVLGVCGGLYKKSILSKNEIMFNESLAMGEDWLFNFQFLKYCNSICLVDKPLYTYNRFNENGCTNNYSLKKDRQMMDVACNILKDDTVASSEYDDSRLHCKLNIYYQALTHAISLCDNYNELNAYTLEIKKLDIYPSALETLKGSNSMRERAYVFFSHFSILWHFIYLKNKQR